MIHLLAAVLLSLTPPNCGTSPPTKAQALQVHETAMTHGPVLEPITVRVHFHIVYYDGGPAQDPWFDGPASVQYQIDIWNQSVPEIQVVLDGITTYNNDAWASGVSIFQFSQIFAANDTPGALDTWFVPVPPGNYAYFLADFNILSWVSVMVNPSPSFPEQTVRKWGHEFGHNLGLHHTHQNFGPLNGCDPATCHEDGDLFCDTPPDPNINNQTYTGGENYTEDWLACIPYELFGDDACGEPYAPDYDNFMSYAPSHCFEKISPLQTQHSYWSAVEVFPHWLESIPVVPCPGDLNGSGDINIDDLVILLNSFGPCP